MTVRELNKKQLELLKQNYYLFILHPDEEADMYDLVFESAKISIEELEDYYGNMIFVPEDFGEDN